MSDAPVCEQCQGTLKMLRRYEFAPSIAWCGSCGLVVDVEYDQEEGEWRVLRSERL